MFVAYKSAFQAHSPTDANKLVSKTSSAPDRFPVTKIKQQKKKKKKLQEESYTRQAHKINFVASNSRLRGLRAPNMRVKPRDCRNFPVRPQEISKTALANVIYFINCFFQD